ncbi:MAG: fused MFS/spermidine synthase, partial [Gammaproteobacteria bacterium]|nr:fused MFS/spermidine synthase [Gammaproteobacteria bacterium]
MTDSNQLKRGMVLLCFFLSGAAGLVYEVVWARQLSLFLGITSFAHTAVITAYMAGLAAGSLYFGRYADSSANPLRTYARLEIGICVYALMTPFMFDFLQAGYADIAGVAGISGMGGHLSRFAIALLALLIPTFLMGGTLPLLVRGFVSTLPELGRATGRLYGINTLGAMSGTLVAGYLLLPEFGIVITTFMAALVNLLIAIYILASIGASEGRREVATSHKNEAVDAAPASAPVPVDRMTRIAILAGFGLAGFASLLTQMAWIRALIMVVGGSVYAFTITLASFLAGIGLGSLLYGWLLSRRWRHLQGAAVLALIIAFSLLAGLPILQKLPEWFLAGFSWLGFEHFMRFQFFIFALCFLIMIVPTVLMGALFPLVAVIWTRSNAHAAQGVGTAYAINTFGTIFGALLGGLFILPVTGVHNGIQLAASVYILSAILFWWPGSQGHSNLNRVAAVAVAIPLFLLAAAMIPPWDRAVMASGVYYRADIT